MKLALLLIFTAILLVGMVACSFGSVPPKILLEGEELQSLTMFVGQELLLSSETASGVAWTSSDDTVVAVEVDGYLRARKEGTATVTVTAEGKSDSITVTVTPYIPVKEVKTVTDTLVIKAGGRKDLGISVLPENVSDPSLTYEIIPADGMLNVVDGVLTASEDAISNANYEIVITNLRSAVSATMQVTILEIRGLTA